MQQQVFSHIYNIYPQFIKDTETNNLSHLWASYPEPLAGFWTMRGTHTDTQGEHAHSTLKGLDQLEIKPKSFLLLGDSTNHFTTRPPHIDVC